MSSVIAVGSSPAFVGMYCSNLRVVVGVPQALLSFLLTKTRPPLCKWNILEDGVKHQSIKKNKKIKLKSWHWSNKNQLVISLYCRKTDLIPSILSDVHALFYLPLFSILAKEANRALSVTGIKVSPLPLTVPGPLTLSFQASLNKPLNNVNLIIEVEKNLGFFGYVKVPCVNEIGSWWVQCQATSGHSWFIWPCFWQIFSLG